MSDGGSDKGPAPKAILGRLMLEFGPLLAFFAGYKAFGFMPATSIFMAAIVFSMGFSWLRRRRLPVLPAFTAAVALAMGGLTLAFHEELFVKLRPTVINGIYALGLMGSMLLHKPLLRQVFQGTLRLTDKGWRGLTWRAAIFLLLLAATNELVWRTQPTDVWVNFKVFGIIPLDVLFALSQWRYVKRHWRAEPAAGRGTVRSGAARSGRR